MVMNVTKRNGQLQQFSRSKLANDLTGMSNDLACNVRGALHSVLLVIAFSMTHSSFRSLAQMNWFSNKSSRGFMIRLDGAARLSRKYGCEHMDCLK